MPSALFHIAIGLLIGLAVLGDDMDARALAIIAFAALLPDIDALLAFKFSGAHRVYLHNVFVFLVPAALLLAARRAGYMRRVTTRWPDAERVLWTAVVVVAVAGVGLDAVASGANLLYPVHDQFYQVQGTVSYSPQHGFEQTVTDVDRARIGSSAEIYYPNGVELAPGRDPRQMTWRVPLFGNTLQLLLSLTVFGIVGYRLRHRRGGIRMVRYFPVTPIRQSRRRR